MQLVNADPLKPIEAPEALPAPTAPIMFSMALAEAVNADLVAKQERAEHGLRVSEGNFFLERARALDPFLGSMRLDELTVEKLRDFRKFRLRACSASTVNKDFQVIRAVLRLAVGKGWLAVNPAMEIKKIPVEAKASRKYLEPGEVDRLMASCTKSKNADLADMVMSYINTGIDKSELLRLRKPWAKTATEPWVDLERGLIVLPGFKTRPPREVAMNKAVREILARRLSQAGDYFFFNRETGRPYDNFKRSFKTACEDAGLKARVKDLRHTFATSLLDAGVPLDKISRLLGHTNPTTTAIYAKMTRKKNLEAVEALDGIFKLEG